VWFSPPLLFDWPLLSRSRREASSVKTLCIVKKHRGDKKC
jgi:hypothetical protein